MFPWLIRTWGSQSPNLSMEGVKVYRCNKNAVIPVRATAGSACFDVYPLIEDGEPAATHILQPGTRTSLCTGLRMEIPEGYCAFLRSRSGWALRGLDVCAGTIDSDYRGEIRVVVHNSGGSEIRITNGVAIAQLFFTEVIHTAFYEVGSPENLSSTGRGDGGFGSTTRTRTSSELRASTQAD